MVADLGALDPARAMSRTLQDPETLYEFSEGRRREHRKGSVGSAQRVPMGNTLLLSQKIACGHTDRLHIRQNLLCDRLSQPTAEMVDALIFLQDHKVDLQNIGETLTQRRHAKELMLATCFCIFFEYLPLAESGDAQRVLETFGSVLRRPDDFLEDLMKLRAQGVPKDKIFRLQPLIHEVDINGTEMRGVLDSLSAFARAALESAQIYSEIRDAAEAGQIDRQQAANLLDCVESDQRRMVTAMDRQDAPVSP